jgi:hypothetical protein
MQNLGKSLRSGRHCSLKSCLRIRASCTPNNTNKNNNDNDKNRNNNYINSSSGSSGAALSGTVRFEAIAPNLSFQISQIKPIPILASPLTRLLLTDPPAVSRGTCSSDFTDTTGSQCGYVTMNQTRKLVFLLGKAPPFLLRFAWLWLRVHYLPARYNHHIVVESDPSVSLVPTVGVWVHFPASASSSSSEEVDAQHPFVWAACVRYLCCEAVRQRVFVDADTFLLVRSAHPSMSTL